jgi:hypothetical protein
MAVTRKVAVQFTPVAPGSPGAQPKTPPDNEHEAIRDGRHRELYRPGTKIARNRTALPEFFERTDALNRLGNRLIGQQNGRLRRGRLKAARAERRPASIAPGINCPQGRIVVRTRYVRFRES